MLEPSRTTVQETISELTAILADKLHGLAVQLGILNAQLGWFKEQVEKDIGEQAKEGNAPLT